MKKQKKNTTKILRDHNGLQKENVGKKKWLGLQPKTDSHLEEHEMKVDSSNQKLKRKKI